MATYLYSKTGRSPREQTNDASTASTFHSPEMKHTCISSPSPQITQLKHMTIIMCVHPYCGPLYAFLCKCVFIFVRIGIRAYIQRLNTLRYYVQKLRITLIVTSARKCIRYECCTFEIVIFLIVTFLKSYRKCLVSSAL